MDFILDTTNQQVVLLENSRITTRDLICWSFQIARGMNHLANKKVTIISHLISIYGLL